MVPSNRALLASKLYEVAAVSSPKQLQLSVSQQVTPYLMVGLRLGALAFLLLKLSSVLCVSVSHVVPALEWKESE